jgi:hypothetical protein
MSNAFVLDGNKLALGLSIFRSRTVYRVLLTKGAEGSPLELKQRLAAAFLVENCAKSVLISENGVLWTEACSTGFRDSYTRYIGDDHTSLAQVVRNNEELLEVSRRFPKEVEEAGGIEPFSKIPISARRAYFLLQEGRNLVWAGMIAVRKRAFNNKRNLATEFVSRKIIAALLIDLILFYILNAQEVSHANLGECDRIASAIIDCVSEALGVLDLPENKATEAPNDSESSAFTDSFPISAADSSLGFGVFGFWFAIELSTELVQKHRVLEMLPSASNPNGIEFAREVLGLWGYIENEARFVARHFYPPLWTSDAALWFSRSWRGLAVCPDRSGKEFTLEDFIIRDDERDEVWCRQRILLGNSVDHKVFFREKRVFSDCYSIIQDHRNEEFSRLALEFEESFSTAEHPFRHMSMALVQSLPMWAIGRLPSTVEETARFINISKCTATVAHELARRAKATQKVLSELKFEVDRDTKNGN